MRKEFKVGDKIQGTATRNFYVVTKVHSDGTFDGRRVKDSYDFSNQDPMWFTSVPADDETPAPPPAIQPVIELKVGQRIRYVNAYGLTYEFEIGGIADHDRGLGLLTKV